MIAGVSVKSTTVQSVSVMIMYPVVSTVYFSNRKVRIAENNVFYPQGGWVFNKKYVFHYARLAAILSPSCRARPGRGGEKYAAFYLKSENSRSELSSFLILTIHFSGIDSSYPSN